MNRVNKDFKNRILNEIKLNDTDLYSLCMELEKDGNLDDNFPIIYSQYKDLDVCRKCKGVCYSDTSYLKPVLEYNNKNLNRIYKPCEYKALQFSTLYMPQEEEIKEVYKNENRAEIFKYIEKAKLKESTKGIYVHGPYGCGKTFLMYKLGKMLAKEQEVIFVYYPELINNIKNMISRNDESYYRTIERIKKVDVLFLDDVGREQNSTFNRDQILGPILQYRAMYNLKTFMTSNYNIKLLKDHFSESRDEINSLNSSAIIERICYLMDVVSLEDKSYR